MISHEKFKELVSLYLDNEATDRQLKTLGRALYEDVKLKNEFLQAVRIHRATCKYFKKEIVLKDICAYMPHTASYTAGWTRVAALVAITFGLISATFSDGSTFSGETHTKSESAPNAASKYEINLSDGDFGVGEDFSLLKISQK